MTKVLFFLTAKLIDKSGFSQKRSRIGQIMVKDKSNQKSSKHQARVKKKSIKVKEKSQKS